MTRKQPSQERSRDRVEQILLSSQSLILESGGLDALTTSAVADATGMSLATVYRYFKDRFEIILALVEREADSLDDVTMRAVASLENVTIESLTRATLQSRFDYFAEHPLTSILWFGARENRSVHDRIDRHYKESMNWLIRGAAECGMLVPNYPQWASESAAWLADQAFETMFAKERPAAERQSMLEGFLELLGDQLAKFTTEIGSDGISSAEFFAVAGDLAYPPVESD